MGSKKIIISKDFTDAPGARYITDGPKSGEQFYNELLKPSFLEAKENGMKLMIDLDNTWGYASSFISGAFGRLSKEFKSEEILSILEFKSKDDPMLIGKIKEEIKNPNQ